MIDYFKYNEEKISNIWYQIFQIIVNPKKVFFTLKSKTDLSLLPVFMMIIGTVFKVIVSFPAQIALNTKYRNQFMSSLPPEQLKQMEQMQQIANTPDSIGFIVNVVISAIIGVFIMWIIKAILLHYISTAIGGKGSIIKSLNVVGISWMPLFLFSIVQGSYALISGSILFTSGRLLDAFLATTNIFIVWNMILLIMGYSAVYGISKGKASVGVISLWLVSFIIAVGGMILGQVLTNSHGVQSFR